MLKLKEYSFSGIGRFVEKQTINLEDRDHLIQFDGENTNTGGSSGAGKSTAIEALAYLLGISEVPSTQLQSRITKSPIWVQGKFEGDIIITRSKKDGLTIETPEETVSGNSKLAEEKLDDIIGVNRNLLKTMAYKRQKQGGFFLNLTPKQSYSFLIEALDLKTFDSKLSKLEDNIRNKFKPTKIQLEATINTSKNNVQQLNSLLEQKTQPSKPVLKDISNHQLQIDALDFDLKNITQQKTQQMLQIGPKPIEPTLPEFEKQNELNDTIKLIDSLKQTMRNNQTKKEEEIQQANNAIYEIEKKINNISVLQKEVISDNEKYSRLLNEYNHLKEEKCPTCLKKWENQDPDRLVRLESQLSDLYKSIDSKELEIQKLDQYNKMLQFGQNILETKKSLVINQLEEQQLNELQEKKRVLENERDNIQSVVRQKYLTSLNEWSEKFNNIESQFKDKENELKKQISILQNEINTVTLQQEAYKQAIESFEKDCENIRKKIIESNFFLESKQEELDETEKNIILSEESIRLIKNFTLQKFQDTLDYIGERATEIINLIPNMSNAVIYFENAKETKSGAIKNEVNAVINLEGDVAVPIKTLSGGERTSADFAIDLAVGEMIENMTKKGVNFLIIDEGFDGLDSISKIECLEILKNLNTNKKIMIIDHSSEVKEMVHDIIKIKRVKEESFVE